jgi:KDO2-lipid IV(A) lauroyltransferase
VATLQYKFCKKDRDAVVSNLRVIMNTNDQYLLNVTAKKVFINFAKYLVDFFRFSLIDGKFIKRYIRIEGSQHLADAAKKGNGIIAFTGHTGNWELSAVVTAYLGYSVNAVALNHKDSRINDFFIRQRESKGIKVVPLGIAVRKCFVALKNNELIGLLGDRDFSGSGMVVEFLGKQLKMPKGPALFSLKYNTPIIPTFLMRQDDDTYKMIYQGPVECPVTGNEEEDLLCLTQKGVSVIENMIKQYPDQWFMFREFWREDANRV